MPSAGQQKVRALLLDLDGVLRLWPRTDTGLETAHDLPAGALRQTAFAPALLLDALEGRISDEAWRAAVESRLLESFPDAAAKMAVKAWSAPIGVVNKPVLELVQRVRRRMPIVLVANATSRLHQDLLALELLTQLDAVVNSSVIGTAKPGSAFYLAALRIAGIEAGEALFVDDQHANVAAAAELGLNAHHFTGHETLSARLHAEGLLHAAD